MAQAAAPPEDSEILRLNRSLTFREGPFRSRIFRSHGQTFYSVSEGARFLTEPIIWVFGKGEAGQTFLFRHDGAYYQSRLSFFIDTRALSLTLGDSAQEPTELEHALGDRLSEGDARKCIGCHETGAVVGTTFRPDAAEPGLGCEACHGPGSRHVAAIQSGRSGVGNIRKLSGLDPYEMDDVCGSCHRTWSDVLLMQLTDVRNVRFQPYRLEKSLCWSATDSRISCLACHDPHQTVVRRASFYDAKCLACHAKPGAGADAGRSAEACPVGARRCVSCHMPKYELPGGHFKFTDHYIRKTEPGAPYPS